MSKKLVFKFKKYLKVYQKDFINKNKKKDKFLEIITKNGTAVIIQDKNGQILLIEEFRIGLNKNTWGLPGGQIDKGSTARKTIIKEVLEETNLKIKDPKLFLKYIVHGNYMICKDFIFICNNFKGKIKTENQNNFKWVNLKNLVNMLLKNKFETAGVIAALTKYIYLREKGLIKV